MKTNITIPFRPPRDPEPVFGVFEAAHQLTKKLGLAELMVSDGVINLGHPFFRKNAFNKSDDLIEIGNVHMEIGVGKTKQDVHRDTVQQYGIYKNTAIDIQKAQHQRVGTVIRQNTTNEIGPLVPVKTPS